MQIFQAKKSSCLFIYLFVGKFFEHLKTCFFFTAWSRSKNTHFLLEEKTPKQKRGRFHIARFIGFLRVPGCSRGGGVPGEA